MRAFLSSDADREPHGHGHSYTDYDGTRSVCLLGGEAINEARRILAETEPETRYSSTFSPITMYRPQSSRSERGQMHAALAEALAAFVADGVSE